MTVARNHRLSRYSGGWWGLPMLCLLVFPALAAAKDNLRIQLASIAQGIKKNVLDKNKENSVRVGQFTGPAALATSAGPGISQRLSDELRKLNVDVRSEADFGVQGNYKVYIDKESENPGIAIEVWAEDKRGNEVYRTRQGVFGDAELAALLGRSFTWPVKADQKERGQALIQSIEKPKVVIDGGKVKSTKDSPFAMEVLIEGEQRAAEDRHGLAFVPIRRKEIYAVRLTNNADFEAAIQLTIDGISMFAFSEIKKKNGEPSYDYIIIPPHQTTTIPGWFINNKKTDSFQVVEYGESAVAKLLQSPTDVGTITAVFSACWESDKEPPPDEKLTMGGDADATGRGPRIDKEYVEVERTFGKPRTTISIRYTKP